MVANGVRTVRAGYGCHRCRPRSRLGGRNRLGAAVTATRARLAFADADDAVGTTLPLADVAPHMPIEKGPGRIECHRCQAIDAPEYL